MNNTPCKPLFIWATGRASSGKSSFIRIAEEECKKKKVNTIILSDEEILFQIIEEDKDHEHHYHPSDKETFLFKTNYPFDEGIRRINNKLNCLLQVALHKPLIALIELARGQCRSVMNVTYEQAFSIIEPNVLQNSRFYYIQSEWAQQTERNKLRGVKNEPHTPESVMQELYSHDDFALISQSVAFEVISNQKDLASFAKTVRQKIRNEIHLLMSQK